MRKLNLDEYDETLDFEHPQTLPKEALYTFVVDSFYFSGINIRSCAHTKYGSKVSERYCENTLMKKLYEDKHIEEWCYMSYRSIKNTLNEFKKNRGFEDEEELRIKLLAMHDLILEFDDYLKKVAYEIED